MATHCIILAWEIPWTEEPGGLQSLRSPKSQTQLSDETTTITHGRISKEINQSILREINPEYSLEGLMLNLKLQYFGHLMCTDYSLEKCLMLGKIEDRG